MKDVWRVNGTDGHPIPARDLSIDGCLLGYYAEAGPNQVQPVLIELSGNRVLPLFSTPEKLRACFAELGLPADLRVKRIEDGPTFLASLPRALPVVLDPFVTERGTTRFTLVQDRSAE